MEGRDIGTAVFPDAEVKIFLDAAPEVRGNRRFRQAAPTETTTARQTQSRQEPAPESAEEQSDLRGRLFSTRCGSAISATAIAPNHRCVQPATRSSSTRLP